MGFPKITQTILNLVISLAMVHASLAQNSPQDYLDAHNIARAQVRIEPLTWDNDVAAYAQRYANQRISDCNMTHSGGPYGENLAKGFPDMTGTGAVDLWVGERENYDYNSNVCISGRVCGHYTQVVWRNSKRLGCGRAQCSDGWWFVTCNYDPPGNYVYERPYFAKFRVLNNCNHTVWPVISSTGQSPALSTSGFSLEPGQSNTLDAPSSWSGRIWGRTQCRTDIYSTRTFTCLTGDCGSGKIECGGRSNPRSTTVAELWLNGSDANNSYAVSLVHGFNLPVLVLPQGGDDRFNCSMAGCKVDVNGVCPPELAVNGTDGKVVACNSACDAFNTSSETCRPTDYSRLFKRACPGAYSYQLDVTNSTFTCAGQDYAFIFCPSPNTSFVKFNDSGGTEVPPSPNCTSYNCSGTADTYLPHCPSFNCGGLIVGYPFWQQDNASLSQYCGYPGFGLNCSTTVVPTFQLLNNSNFYIQRINYSDNILTMGDIDVLNHSCPRPRHNLTLNNLPLYPSSSSLNLSFYFNCSSPLSFASSIACLASSSNQSYVSLMSSRPENFSWIDYCEDSVVVTVMGSAVDVNNLNSTYQRGINQGFMLNWQPSFECRVCEKSEGSCGFDRRTQKFLCFCDDGDTTTGQCSGSMTHNQPNQAWKIGIGIGAALVAILTSSVLLYLYRRKKDSSSASRTFWKWKTGYNDKVETFILQYGASAPKRYKYSDVKRITNSFKDELGKGGYGKVFKGKLADGRLVAVKVLNAAKGDGEDFMNEVASIGRTSHVNIVTLLGFCYEGRKRALIYEFMPNGSLDKFIYGNDRTEELTQHLRVEKLYEIALGIARGLEYLHRGCNTRILHLDIKPHNVLLDEDFCPKLSDFGLAKLYPKKKSKLTMPEARGTIGYIAPEVFNRNLGGVSDKSDVYSYGMMVIEIVGGRNNSNNAEANSSSEKYFPNWIYKRLEQDEDLQLQQQGPMTMAENEIARKMMLVGLWCIQTDPSQRPSINKVVEMLEGSFEALEVPPRPFFSSPSRSRTNTTTTS